MFVKAFVELWKAAWSVLSEFGVSGSAIGGISALLMAWWASLLAQPAWFLAFVAITTFAAVLSIYVLIRAYIQILRKLPAYEKWDLVDPIPIWQAACLWAGKQPVSPVDSGTEYACLQMMKSALQTKKIRPYRRDEVGTGMLVMVSRAELIKFAESTPERPRFLFKDER